MPGFIKKIIIFSVISILGNSLFPVFLVHAETNKVLKVTPAIEISNIEKTHVLSRENAKTESAKTSPIVSQKVSFEDILTDGIFVVKSSVETGMQLSFETYKDLFQKLDREVAVIKKSFIAKTPHFAAVSFSSAASSLWCSITNFFGFDCVSSSPSVLVRNTDRKIPTTTPAITINEEEKTQIAETVKTPEAIVTRPSTPTQSNQVLSFSAIVSSLQNVFAPLSTVGRLETRISEMEGSIASSQKTQSDILALQKRVDSLTSSNIFNPTYSYTPTAMVGADTKAVIFNAGGPNGVFENNVSSQTATFSEGLSAGSITTGGSLSVTGATTLVGALTAGSTLYVDAVNGRLGVGTSTPTDTFSVNGPMYLASATPSVTSNRLYNSGSNLY